MAKHKDILNAALKALLAGVEASAWVKIPATFISEIASLPEDKRDALGNASAEKFDELLAQAEISTTNAALAAVGTKQVKVLVSNLARLSVDKLDALAKLTQDQLEEILGILIAIHKNTEDIKTGIEKNQSAIDGIRAQADDDKKRTAERRWQYIQNHPIRSIEILFILKGAVGFDWFREILEDTRLTFSRDKPSFKLGQLLVASPDPNTKEPSPTMERCVCSYWEIYEPEKGYWFKKIAPNVRAFTTVAGFDATAHWSVLGVKHVEKLQDIGLLTEVGVSIPARAYQVGVEEFAFRFIGDTFSFSVRLSEHGLSFLHEMASTQHVVVKDGKPAPIGSIFSGVQLLEMFYSQLLPRQKNEESKHEFGFGGISGPSGKAMSFYPMMPKGFMETAESKEYTFTITVPGKIDTASRIKKLEQKLKSDPTDTRAYGELAALYSQEGRLQDALKCLETAFEKAPPMAEVHGLMAQCLAEVGRHDEALAHLKKAEVLAPKNTMVQTSLGVCLQELGKYEEALTHFQAAARIEPSKASCQFNLSMAFAAVERYSEALAPAQRAVVLAPDDHRAEMHLGVLLTMEDQTTEAIHHFEKATRLSPKSGDAYELLGQHLAKTNQHEKAVVSLQQAVKIEKTAMRYGLLGESLAGLSRWAEAEVAYRCGLKLEPNHSAMLTNLGAAIATLGRLPEAAETFEQAIRADPSNVTAQQNLAQLRKMMAMNQTTDRPRDE